MVAVAHGLIVGGGIAGLASAIALEQIGVHCDVAEIGDFGTVGAGIGIAGRAPNALQELGVYDEVAAMRGVEWASLPRGVTMTARGDGAVSRGVHAKVYRFWRAGADPIEVHVIGSHNLTTPAISGRHNWETSVIIGRSKKTVEFHIANAIRKLNAVNKNQAALIAYNRGLIS